MISSNHLIFCHPLSLLPSIFPSIRFFSSESHQGFTLVLPIRWPKYWSFSFSISPSNECSGLISFRMDWLHLLAVQGTLKSLLQHHSSKASILWCSAFFIVQLSHPYLNTGKNIALTRWTFIGRTHRYGVRVSSTKSQFMVLVRVISTPLCSVASDSFVKSRTVTYQASLSMGFPRQGYWIGLPFPSLGHLPNPGIEPRSLAL